MPTVSCASLFCGSCHIRHSNGPVVVVLWIQVGMLGAEMGRLRDDPEFWRLQAEDAKKNPSRRSHVNTSA